MIFNMAVDDGGNNTLGIMDPTQIQQGQCAYNFLKRKHDGVDTISSAEINNQTGNITAYYQDTSETNAWKKRHVEHSTSPTSNLNTNCFNNSNDLINNNQISTANTLTVDYNQTTQHIEPTLSNINNNDTTTVNNNSNNNNNNNNNNINNNINNNNNNNNDVTFNFIGSSTFINDLFGYDGGLIVPVSVNCSTNADIIPAAPTFTTVTNVHESFDESTNWQATDLLELDHRYNSGLQMEITQLTPTINLRQAVNDGQTQQTNPDDNFLVPQKLPSNLAPLTKYRSVNNLPILESLPKTDSETDFEDKNLSWLLNFKFDELPHLSPDISGGNVVSNGNGNNQVNANGNQKLQSNSHSAIANDRSRSPKTSTSKTGKKFEELVMEVTSEVDGNEMVVAENVTVENTLAKAVKKPPFTYTELIEYALEDKGELTVSGIYQWISDRFPYYKSNDDRWKNSVRHNLSINPHFRKGVKAPQGAGHLWTISSGDSAENVLAWEHKKQRLELFFKMESMNRERLQQHQQQQQQLAQQQCASPHNHNHQSCHEGQRCLYEEAAQAAATISQEMQQKQQQSTTAHTDCTTTSNNENHQQHLSNNQILHELPFNDLMSDEELRKTAGQILNGIHREVEVQSVNSIISTYHDVLLDNDYLNPIHKDVAVNESGLRHCIGTQQSSSQYYVTEIDPLELGIHINPISNVPVHEVEEVLFNDDFNLNHYFGFGAGNDIVA